MAKSHELPSSQGLARRRAVEIIEKMPIIAGSIVDMVHTCGKPSCRCALGDKHVSPYLGVRRKGKRVMISIPRSQEVEVREAVGAFKELSSLIDAISQDSVNGFIAKKKGGKR